MFNIPSSSYFSDLPFDFMKDDVNPQDFGINVYKLRIESLNKDQYLMSNRALIFKTLQALLTTAFAQGQISDEGYADVLENLHKNVGEDCERALNAAGFKTVSKYSIYPNTLAKDKVELLFWWSRSSHISTNYSHAPQNTKFKDPLNNDESDQKTSYVQSHPLGPTQQTMATAWSTSSHVKPIPHRQRENPAPPPPPPADKLRSTPNLTKKKQAFLSSPETSWQMKASKVEAIANFYQKKYPGVVIFKNGCSPLGQKLIEQRQDELRKKLADSLQPYRDEQTCYSKVAGWGFWLGGAADDGYDLNALSIGDAQSSYLKALLSNYLDNMNFFKSSLTPQDWNDINELIKQDVKAREIAKKQIARYIDDHEKEHPSRVNDCCLTRDETTQEISFFQRSLDDNDVVGYMFTNGKFNTKEHFEVLLISKEIIIKAVSWFSVEKERTLIYQHDSIWAETMLDSPLVLVARNSKKSLPQPQADDWACGTLGILYVKELLKEDSSQLKEYTLSFPLSGEKKQPWFFYPSPHVLRYSQSRQYNETIASMLADTAEVQVGDFKYFTLKKLLENSIPTAKAAGNQAAVTHNKAILDRLPEFRKKWLDAYNTMMQKRETMTYTREGKRWTGQNVYLAAATDRLKQLSEGR